MNINEILLDDEKAYIYMERYVNNGSPSGFSKNTTSEKTQPQGETTSFPVKIIRFDETIRMEEIGKTRFNVLPDRCFFCHPDTLEHEILINIKEHWEIVGEIEVAPTASGRTVKCIGDNKFFLKLDYLGRLGRITRNLDTPHIQSANEVTTILKEAVLNGKMNSKFAFLLEDFGRVAYLPMENGGTYEIGFILRDNQLFKAQNSSEKFFLIPAFSLFGTDMKRPNDKPIIAQLFKEQDKSINEFAFEDVLKPIIDCYFDVLLNCGLCLEAHAQNTLIAIDEHYQIRYIVARDLESVDKDLSLREFFGYSNDIILAKNYKCLRNTDYNYTIKHSFMFDFKLGNYLLDPLLETFQKYFSEFKAEEIVGKIKAITHAYIDKLPQDYYPEKWYDYEKEIFDLDKKRPYIAHTNPRYR